VVLFASLFPSAGTAAPAPDPWAEPEYTKEWETDPEAPPEPPPRLGGSELRSEIPDLEIQRWPPPFRGSVFFGAHYPLQILGLGGELELYAPDWLRLNLIYSVGFATKRRDFFVSHYTELLIGFRVLGLATGTEVDVLAPEPPTSDWGVTSPYTGRAPLEAPTAAAPGARPGRAGPGPTSRPTREVTLRAWLPSDHALFVELGGFTGPLFLERCVANCTPELDEGTFDSRIRQLVFPVAGLRYVYFAHATSKKTPAINRRMLVQAHAHLLGKAWNDWEAGTYYGELASARHGLFGGRVGVQVPTCSSKRCASIGLVLGYLPTPGTIVVESAVGY